MIIGQYYQFVRLGFEGYKKIMASLLNVSQRLQEGVEKLGICSLSPLLTNMALTVVPHPLRTVTPPPENMMN